MSSTVQSLPLPSPGPEELLAAVKSKSFRKRDEILARYRSQGRDWRTTVGAFENDPDFERALKRGSEWREQANRAELDEDS